MRLFHFSENPAIETFVPRPVAIPPKRPPGREWLNGPLIWAIDDWHQPLYLFPRDCPRILIWPVEHTSVEDRDRYWGEGESRMIAFIERRWLPALRSGSICRYKLPAVSFERLEDAGAWVSRTTVQPLHMDVIAALPTALARHGVELRPMDDLAPLKDLWCTSLHASGIRLRNAVGWDG